MNYQYYGTMSTSQEVTKFLSHCLGSNSPTPICIWGKHGIGKTELVEQFAKEHKYQFSYIAPAQFEEMGDLIGMPVVKDGKTEFSPPSWVPTQQGPGILLIDDVNRADDRILRGIMQLLQNKELVSWKLPENWFIVLTANPDGGDYSVTPLDDAMLTRMMHISMNFDAKAWARWAEQAGIDTRGISFVLTYPELVQGNRTTPRSLVQFFNSLATIPDLSKEIELIQLLGDACMDEQTVAGFIAFVNNDLKQLLAPETILGAKSFEEEVLQPLSHLALTKNVRVDILSTICSRLVNYLVTHQIKPDRDQLKNIKAFMNIDFIPNDLRFNLASDLVNSSNSHLKLIMADPVVSKLLLSRM